MMIEEVLEKHTEADWILRAMIVKSDAGRIYAPCETERLQTMTLYSQEIETRRAVDSLSMAARQYCRIRYRFANDPAHGSHWTI
jgi:hypothetical protein